MDVKWPRIAEHFSLRLEDLKSQLRDHMAAINVALEKFAFKIETVREQESGKLQYIFINTRFDDIIQGCTPYSPPELDAIKQLIDEIVNADDFEFCFPYGNAKQLVGSILKQKASDAAYLIARLVDDGWVEIHLRNRLVLLPASLAELKVYLVDRFGQFLAEDSLGKMLNCKTCGDLVTLGLKCESGECAVAFHRKCAEIFKRDNDVCPGVECLESLDKLVPVGPAPQQE